MAVDIVEIKHIMLPPSPREFKDIYVVFELMETDLHQVCSVRTHMGFLLQFFDLLTRVDGVVQKFQRIDLLQFQCLPIAGYQS